MTSGGEWTNGGGIKLWWGRESTGGIFAGGGG